MKPVVWLPKKILQHCLFEATACYPLETGGTFMGYWTGTETAVVTAKVDAGPNALRKRYSFQPDQDWQLDEIARIYNVSGRRETYLGDWHTHPNAQSGKLSAVDRSVLRKVMKSTAARCPKPLMGILWGQPSKWHSTIWLSQIQKRKMPWNQLKVKELEARSYSGQ